jgi:hypothetical protein
MAVGFVGPARMNLLRCCGRPDEPERGVRPPPGSHFFLKEVFPMATSKSPSELSLTSQATQSRLADKDEAYEAPELLQVGTLNELQAKTGSGYDSLNHYYPWR